MFLNWFLRRLIIGPLARLFFHVRVVGLRNIPKKGPFILAIGPHRTEFESILLAVNLPRYTLRFFAKQEYWDDHKVLGWIMTRIGLIPLSRSVGRATVEQIKLGVEALKHGDVIALYPEATRGFDEAMHRGYTGLAYISLRSGGIPIVPVGMIGFRSLNPPGEGLHPGKATINVGKPIYPLASVSEPERHRLTEKMLEQALVKPLTKRVSMEIASLAGVEYIDKELTIPVHAPTPSADKGASDKPNESKK